MNTLKSRDTSLKYHNFWALPLSHRYISGEFLIHGVSEALLCHLYFIYINILYFNYIPAVFNNGVMASVLKKQTPTPALPGNYRPIIVSSVFYKLFEILIYPGQVPLCKH